MTQQESQQNLYAFAELEYMLNLYFQKNVRGIVDSSYKHLKEKQSEEYIRTLDNRPVAPGMSGIMNASMVAQNVRRTGEWNTKHTEDLVNTIHDRLYMDKSSTQHDIGMFIVEWKKLAKARLGDAEYERLSKEVGTDLSAYYISHRLDDLSIQRIAKLGAPESTLGYVLTTGMKESLAGVIAGMPNHTESSLDKRVAHMQEESFGDVAKFAGRALGFGIDMITPGAKVRGIWAGIDIAIRGVSYAHLDGQWKDYDTFEKDLGKVMFGKENAMSTLRSSKLGISQCSDGVQVLNSEMKKKVFVASVDMDKVNLVYKAVEKAVGGDTEKMANMVRDNLIGHKIKINESSQVPGWMLGKDTDWLIRNSAYYTAMALEMKSKGIQTKKIGNRMWSLNEVAQRGYDYASAGYQKQLSQVKKEVQEAEKIVSQQAQGQSQSGEVQPYQASYVQTEHGQLQIGNANVSQQQNKATAVSQAYQQENVSGYPKGNTSLLGGWGQMFDSIGLGGFGEVGKNLGYVLAMLPDMLIGMFTGKSRNLKFGDNLLPISAILMGMFTKNPLLKMLLVGLGGANLLNKAGQEILENRDGIKAKPVRQYLDYGNEMLDGRIKDPAMKGNTLIATIDGVPSVITINSADAVDAYYKGKLPLNTLANAVLRKYDEQQQSVQENFDRQVAADERMEVSRGLK